MCDNAINTQQLKPVVADAFITLIRSRSRNQLTDLQIQQEKELSVKLLVLFSLLAQRKVCLDVMAVRDFEIIQRLYDNCVIEVCYSALKQGEAVVFNGDWIKPYLREDPGAIEIKRERDHRAQLAYNDAIAKVGLAYFIKMLTALYTRDPTLKVVRQLINKLFSSDHFKLLPYSDVDSKRKITELTAQAAAAN